MSPEKGQACKIRFNPTRKVYEFFFKAKGGEVLRMQTTVRAAGGSQDEAHRIAVRCLEKCEEGWPKEKIVEFRNSLYEEVIKCVEAGKDENPKRGDEEPKPSGLCRQQHHHQQQQSNRPKKEDGQQIEGKPVQGACPATEVMAAAEAAGPIDVDVVSSASEALPEQESSELSPPERESRLGKRRSTEDSAQDIAEHREPLITEDVPSDSPAFKAVKYEACSRAFWFEFHRKEAGEKIRMQTTIPAAGGCLENAARIARLCYAEVAAGASKEEALKLRAELYKRCGPPVVKQRPEPCETFRNLFGETVSINPAAKCVAGPGPKPWKELEQSDLDRFNGDEIYHYEKEIGLGTRRSLEERIARIEQMAQKTTVQHLVKPGGRGNSDPKSIAGEVLADIAAYLENAESEQDFEARFLQTFLAVPAEERQHTSATEVGMLERIARIPDGAFLSMPERRARLKEHLWASRTSPSSSRESFFLKSWLKSEAA